MKAHDFFQARNLTLTLFLLPLLACRSGAPAPANATPGNPPEAAVDIAVAAAKGHWAASKNFQVSCAEQLPVTSADNENGLQEKWCITISFVYKFNASAEWADMRRTCVVTRQAGVWRDVSPMIVECCQDWKKAR